MSRSGKQTSPFLHERLIVDSIGNRAMVFGECESLGMVAKYDRASGVTFSLDDCGILMDAHLASVVLYSKLDYMGILPA